MNENVTFNVDVSRYLQGIASIQAKERELRRDQKATALAVSKGSKEAVNSYMQQAGMLQKLSMEKKKLNQQLAAVTGTNQQFGRSLGGVNMALTQVAFAADDFMNVVGTQGVGAAVRATSNNISTMAVAIHPLAGVLTVAGMAAVSYALGTKKAGDATEDLTKRMAKAEAIAEKFKGRLEELRDQTLRAGRPDEEVQQIMDRRAHEAARGGLQQQLGELQGQIKPASSFIQENREALEQLDRAKAVGDEGGILRAHERLADIERRRKDNAGRMSEARGVGAQIGELDRAQADRDRARQGAFVKNVLNRAPGFMKGIRETINEGLGNVTIQAQQRRVEIQQRKVKGAKDELEDFRDDINGRPSRQQQKQIDALEKNIKVQERLTEVLEEELRLKEREIRGEGPEGALLELIEKMVMMNRPVFFGGQRGP